MSNFKVFIDGVEQVKGFSKKSHSPMNGTWAKFNEWAKKNGATNAVEGNYLGEMAWSTSTGNIVELREVA